MKILLVSTIPTHPVNAGNSHWTLSQVEFLKSLGHEVYFLYVKMESLRHPLNDTHNELYAYWGEHLYVYDKGVMGRIWYTAICKIRQWFFNGKYKCDTLYPNGLSAYVRKLHKKFQFDTCIVNYYWLTRLFKDVRFSRTAINTHDCFSFKSILGGKNAWMDTNPNEEAKGLQRCDYIFALQDDEATFFSKLSPLSKTLRVYCFFQFHDMPVIGNHNLLYLSSANPYNIHGLRWFLDEIFPMMKKAIPDLRLIVGGSICKALHDQEANKDLELVGYVDDLRGFFKNGDVVINPCYEGTGLKIKTFEGVAWGKVVMAHPHSTHGIFRKDASPIFSSEDPMKWRDFLKNIFSHSRAIEEIKQKDKQYIEEMNEFIKCEYESFFSSVK